MKRMVSLALALALSAGLGGCVATPDRSAVVQKDSDALVEAAAAGAEEGAALADVALQAAGHYNYEYENGAGTLFVTVDADVLLPERDTMPMYCVSGGEFDHDLLMAVYDYLMGDEETYVVSGTDLTKADCEEKIVYYQKRLAELENDAGLTDQARELALSTCTDQISNWQQNYENFPEESTLVKTPVTTDSQKGNCFSDNAHFYFVNGAASASSGGDLFYEHTDGPSYDAYSGDPVTAETADAMAEGQVGISYAGAKAAADDFFAAIGVDAEVAAAFLVQGYDDDAATQAALAGEDYYSRQTYTAYRFTYARVVDGCRVAATSCDEIYHEDANLDWLYEHINIIVNEQGIVWLKWEYPVAVEEKLSDNVGVLSFDEAVEIFETMMPVKYEGLMEDNAESNSYTYRITVNQIELCLLRVRDSAERTGMYVPAWVFYGEEVKHWRNYTQSADEWYEADLGKTPPWIILAVNAVDGSVVDLLSGY